MLKHNTFNFEQHSRLDSASRQLTNENQLKCVLTIKPFFLDCTTFFLPPPGSRHDCFVYARFGAISVVGCHWQIPLHSLRSPVSTLHFPQPCEDFDRDNMDFRWVIGFFKNRKRLAWFCVDGFSVLSSCQVRRSFTATNKLPNRAWAIKTASAHDDNESFPFPNLRNFSSLLFRFRLARTFFIFALSIFLAFIPAICKSSALLIEKKS